MRILLGAVIAGVVVLTAFLAHKPAFTSEVNQSAAGKVLPAGFQAASFSCW